MRTTVEATFWTRDGLLGQLPAALVDDELFDTWGIHDNTPALLRVGLDSINVWLIRRRQEISVAELAMAPSGTVWLDSRTAAFLDVKANSGSLGQMEFEFVRLQSQPMRIDHPFSSNYAVVGNATLSALGSSGRYALVRSDQRCMTVKLRKSDGYVQVETKIRLNYHARLLLGLTSTSSATRPQVFVHQFNNQNPWPSKRWALRSFLRDGPSTLSEVVGRFLLNAPTASLVVRSSASADDAMQVVRCSTETFDVLGVESGDLVRVGWGGREITVRAFVAESSATSPSGGPEIISWNAPILEDNIPSNSSITVPSGVRARLGVPRDGVVNVRRSINGLLRKRAISLSLPLVGVAVSVWGLNVSVWMGAGVLVLSGALTLVADRIPATRISTKRGW